MVTIKFFKVCKALISLPLHFAEEETKALHGQVTCSRPFSQSGTELGLEPRVLAPRPEAFPLLHRPHLASASVRVWPWSPRPGVNLQGADSLLTTGGHPLGQRDWVGWIFIGHA